jgi:hypothetical protein
MGMKATRSGIIAQRTISKILIPPEAYKYLQTRKASIATVITVYSDL